jgi:hypothetical protein
MLSRRISVQPNAAAVLIPPEARHRNLSISEANANRLRQGLQNQVIAGAAAAPSSSASQRQSLLPSFFGPGQANAKPANEMNEGELLDALMALQ